MLASVTYLLVFDLIFFAVCLVVLYLLSSRRKAAYAVFKRNILGYFNNPAGYVFLCVFVLMGSIAAFRPHDFFNSNLANLDQLNRWIPLILLVFIPTITMSIWSEERRQGTDELLLTIPAGDWDIVLGKYLAAIGIFTVSLLVSQISNFMVLNLLAIGDIDVGLFATTYFGYWVMGLAMIALGMAASFLTSNLTIGFIFGLLFIAPFVAMQYFGVDRLERFSFSSQSFDFSRGVVSLSSIIFFSLLTLIGLYISVVMIGKRHWHGGKDGQSLFGHYVFRATALLVTLVGLTLFFGKNLPVRWDTTSEKISSLSGDTKDLLAQVNTEQPILIEAFISSEVPDEYSPVKSDLMTKLNEFDRSNRGIEVRVYDDIELLSEEAQRAEEQFGITPQPVYFRKKGAMSQGELIMGVAVTSGLEKVVVPFFDMGVPVEYELVRSIATVSEDTRPRLGVLTTDARMFGGFDPMRGPTPKEPIIEELEKQYEVVEINPSSRIEEEVDVLLAVQPSSLTQPQMDNFVEAVRNGTPTAIFEDPISQFFQVVGTSQPKRPQGGMMGMQQPPEPKGDMAPLLALLGIDMLSAGNSGMPAGFPGMGPSKDVRSVWQDYNPYKKAAGLNIITKDWVFISPQNPEAEEPFPAENAVSSDLRELLFVYPGGIENKQTEGLTFVPIAKTASGTGAGWVNSSDVMGALMSRDPRQQMQLDGKRTTAVDPIVVAAGIFSDPELIQTDAEATEESEDDATAKGINAIFVADIDCLSRAFIQIRNRTDEEYNWKFDNVPFVLNVIDVLAGDRRFVDIRKRQTRHSTLKLIEGKIAEASEESDGVIKQFREEFEAAVQKVQDEIQKDTDAARAEVTELQSNPPEGMDAFALRGKIAEKQRELDIKNAINTRRLEVEMARMNRDFTRKQKSIQLQTEQKIEAVKNRYKNLAVVIPPIPPLVLGLTVFLRRRYLEREGITAARRR